MMSEEAEDPESTGEFLFKLPSPLETWDDGEPFDRSLNCHGVVHVRLICAQRLPCPVGSSVCATVSLLPWQGRVRTKRTPSFLSSYEHGVCVHWDTSTTGGLCSMVNAWSSEESPIPDIACDIMFSPLGVGLFDFKMCSVLVSCEVLMKHPGVWKKSWFQAVEIDAKQKSATGQSVEGSSPLVKLEAMFAPSAPGPTRSIPKVKQEPVNPEQDAVVNDGGGEDDDGDGGEDGEDGDEDNDNQQAKPADVAQNAASPTIAAAQVDEPPDSAENKTPKEELLPDVAAHPHLLRVESSWVPKNCCVCSKVMFGRNKCFSCEVCSVICCADCRLHVDLQLPCGSSAAKSAAEDARRKAISVDNILSVVAPDEGFVQKTNPDVLSADCKPHHDNSKLAPQSSTGRVDGIGCLSIEFTSACLFQHPLPAYTRPSVAFNEGERTGARIGDYYARISIPGVGATSRTRTLQNTGVPKFEAPEMQFNVNHYGEEFRLELVDAGTDVLVGSATTTAHSLILDQKDLIGSKEGYSLFQALRGPAIWKGKRTVKLLLRHDKKGSGKQKKTAESGIITGWLEVRICLEEYIDRLYGRTATECPRRPTPELNMANFQTHVARLKRLLSDVGDAFAAYTYLVSWKNPVLTGTTFIGFVILCLFFDAEYIGCIPFIGPLLWMAYSSYTRDVAGVRERFIRDEINAYKKVKDTKVSYTLHRPIGTIEITVSKGCRVCSRDLGMPGKSACHVLWDPLRYADKKVKETIVKYDKSAETEHEIGHTDRPFSSEPVWGDISESDETRRLKHFLPWEAGFFESTGQDCHALRFPILQPLSMKSSRKDSLGRYVDTELNEWSASPAGIVIRVRFQDFLNNLPGFDHILGEVVFPFQRVVEAGEVSGWFEVLTVGSRSMSPCLTDDAVESMRDTAVENSPSVVYQPPLVLATMKWFPPRADKGSETDESERVASHVVQEELVRSSVLSRNRKADFFETSIGAVSTALGIGGNVQVIQNYVGKVVDFLEIASNALNFTDPFFSSVLFFVIFLVFLVFVVVPTRYIILILGLAQFGATFVARFGGKLGLSRSPQQGRRSSQLQLGVESAPAKQESGANVGTWIKNGILSLPTRQDIRKMCDWDCRRLVAQEREKQASQDRIALLKRLWKASWFSQVQIRAPGREISSGERGMWEPAFAVMEGHRFMWWLSAEDFDNGEAPDGRIFLSGHSGLTGPSPAECKELRADEIPLIIGIFGRGPSGQERVIMLVPEPAVKEDLETVVYGLTSKDD